MRAALERRDAEIARLRAAFREREGSRAVALERLIEAQEAERRRVARHLHDELAQTLTGLLLSLEAAESTLGDAPQGLREQLGRTRSIASEALEQTRRLVLDLRPTVLDDLGLVAALRWLASDRLAATGAAVAVHVQGDDARLTPGQATALFRIAQEAVGNIARHARAERVNVRLVLDTASARLTVSDDGVGFRPEETERIGPSGRGLGLLGIRERAELAGGSASVRSRFGEGTVVEATLPLAEPRREGEVDR